MKDFKEISSNLKKTLTILIHDRSGYYDREIEKSKDSGRGRDSLFKDRRTSTSSRHKSESEGDQAMAQAEETSSVTSVDMLPLEEPEPEIPKRKIIRVTKAVKLRDFTNEERGEEEKEEEKEKEKEKELRDAQKPRGWKTENDEG